MFSLHPRATLVTVLRPGYRRVTTIWGLYRVLVQLATTARLRQESGAGTPVPPPRVTVVIVLRPGGRRVSTTRGWYRVLVQLATTARLRQASRAGTSLPPVSYTHLRAHETRH